MSIPVMMNICTYSQIQYYLRRIFVFAIILFIILLMRQLQRTLFRLQNSIRISNITDIDIQTCCCHSLKNVNSILQIKCAHRTIPNRGVGHPYLIRHDKGSTKNWYDVKWLGSVGKIDPKASMMKNWGCQNGGGFPQLLLVKNYHLKPLEGSGTMSSFYTNNVWVLLCHKRFWPKLETRPIQ